MSNNDVFYKVLEHRLKYPLWQEEMEIIDNYLLKNPLKLMKSKKDIEFHIGNILRKLHSYRSAKISTANILDLKEYQIQQIGTADEDYQLNEKKHDGTMTPTINGVAQIAKIEALFLIEIGDVYELSKSVAPKSKLKYNYLMLDSNNCDDITENRTKFTWLLREEMPILKKGYINLHSKMRNIVMARLGRITMAHQSIPFTDQALGKNRFAFGFEEFTSQALITPDGTKFQFIEFLQEFDTNYGTTVTLSPFNANRGWFRFRERFKMLDKLSLTITNLNTSIKYTLPDDYQVIPGMQSTSHSAIDPALGILLNPLTISQTYLPVNYQYGSLGYIYNDTATVQETYLVGGLDSGDPVVDAAYNGVVRTLVYWGAPSVFYFDGYTLIGPPIGDFPITLTLQYKPRFTGVLELISEDDSDDDIAV